MYNLHYDEKPELLCTTRRRTVAVVERENAGSGRILHRYIGKMSAKSNPNCIKARDVSERNAIHAGQIISPLGNKSIGCEGILRKRRYLLNLLGMMSAARCI